MNRGYGIFFRFFLLFAVAGGGFGVVNAGTDTVYLTLNQTLEMALKRSPLAKEAGADRWQAVLSAGEGVAALLPTPGLSFSKQETELGTSYNVNWSINQPVFDPYLFKALVNGIISASYYSLSARERTARLVYDVTSAYFNLVRARLLYTAAVKGVEQAEQNHRVAQERFQLGQVPEFEWLRAKAFFSRAQLGLLNAEKTLKTARVGLCALAGINPNKAVMPADEIKEPATIPEFDSEEVLARIMEFNPGLQLADRVKNQAMVSLVAAFLRFLPSVSFYQSAQYSDSTLPANWQSGKEQMVRTSGWSFSLPIADVKGFILNLGGAINASRRSRAEFTRAKLELYVTAQNAILEYEEALRRYHQAKENLSLNQELYQLALTRYQLGSIAQSELLEIEAELARAESDYLSALCDTFIQSAQIAYLLGLVGKERGERR